MTCFSFILFLFLFFATYMINNVISFNSEGIIGGLYVRDDQFPYQVGVLIPENDEYPYKLIGSGCIISPKLALSVAQLFVTNDGVLIDYLYSLTYDTINWRYRQGEVVLIDNIYLQSGGNYHYSNNIAVTSIKGYFPIHNNPRVNKVNIPSIEESFYNQEGETSGYGYVSVLMESDLNGKPKRVSGVSMHWLQYADARVENHNKCKIGNKLINPETHFCGQMIPREGIIISGLCDYDDGSPLVINNKVVGLSGTNREDCDDTNTWGSPYTNVSHYSEFINSMIEEKPLNNVIVRRNPIPVPMVAAAA